MRWTRIHVHFVCNISDTLSTLDRKSWQHQNPNHFTTDDLAVA